MSFISISVLRIVGTTTVPADLIKILLERFSICPDVIEKLAISALPVIKFEVLASPVISSSRTGASLLIPILLVLTSRYKSVVAGSVLSLLKARSAPFL